MSFDNTIDFKDHIVQYPNRFKQTTVAPGVVELVPTWITNSDEIIEPGTPVDSELFKKLKQNVTIYQKTFTTTENQTVINLNRDFLVGQNRVSLSIGGVRQYVGQDYTETDSHTLTMTSPLKGGLKSEVIMFTASQAIAEDFFEKTVEAIAATQAANNAANVANEAAEVAFSASLNWRTPVDNFSQLSSVSSPQARDTIMTRDSGKVYRYNGTSWLEIQDIDPLAFNDLDSRLTNKMTKQRNYLSAFYQKLMRGQDVKIVCQGDSLTYGFDTTSSDKRPINPLPADDGTTHVYTRASKTYPEALQEYLRKVYSNNSTVINKGYSGDWLAASLNRWTNNEQADAAILMIGTNDANLNATYIPSEIRGNIQRYLEDYRTLIERYTKWGTAVVLLTPPRLLAQENPKTTSGIYLEPYRLAVMLLGEEYGVPVIDVESFMNGCDTTYYSDSVHFSGKGYTYIASRLVSAFIGFGEFNKVTIQAGDTLSVRQTRDNFVSKDVLLTEDAGSYGPEEDTPEKGLLASIGATSHMSFGFETLEDNLIFIPVYSSEGGASLRTSLDFANEQGSIPLLSAAHTGLPQGQKPLSQIISSLVTANTSAYDGTIGIAQTDRYIHITNKGWHNLTIENPAGVGYVYFDGFVVLSFEDFIQRQVSMLSVCTPFIRGGNVSGSHNYSRQIGRYVNDKKQRMITVSIDLQCVIDNTIDGYVTIPLGTPHLAVNSIGFSVAISYAENFLTDKSPIYGWLPPETNEIILQTPNAGPMNVIEGSTLRGKTIKIVATVTYFY